MTRYSEQFLTALRNAGSAGVPNYELAKIALQYNFEIHVLRKKGYDIRKKRVYREGKASSTWLYYLTGEPNKEPVRMTRDKLTHIEGEIKEEPPKLFNTEPKRRIWL